MVDKERLQVVLGAMWRAKGTAFQAKEIASRKMLRLAGAGYVLGPERKYACGSSSQRDQVVNASGMWGRSRADRGSLVGPRCGEVAMTSLFILQVPRSLGGELAGENQKKRELSETI